jgi:pyruvate/2-oxoglutarate dehydrogenase complex dihydrolipoamide dehydrogenase (E3) component
LLPDPEVAQVGLTEAQAVAAHAGARVAFLPISEADRAVTAGRTKGFVKIIAGRRRVLNSESPLLPELGQVSILKGSVTR